MGASGFDVDTHSEPAFSLEQKKSISGTGFGAASNRSHEPPRPRDRHSPVELGEENQESRGIFARCEKALPYLHFN
jgi:hypothetical protein